MPNKLVLTIVLTATLLSAAAKAIATSTGFATGADIVSGFDPDSAG